MLSTSPSRGSNTSFIYVLSDVDGCKYKLVVKGGLERLTLGKIKQHLVQATGISYSDQVLTLNGIVLADDGGTENWRHQLQVGSALRLSSTQQIAVTSSASTSHAGDRSQSALREGRAVSSSPSSSNVYRSLFVDRSSRSQSRPGKGEWRAQNSIGEPDRWRSRSASNGLSLEHETEGSHPMQDNSSSASTTSRLQVENVALRQRIAELEQQCQLLQQEVANATSDWKLEEEMDRLRRELAEEETKRSLLARNLEAKWQLRENDLVRELDRCREERRQLREEREALAEEYHQRLTEAQVALRLRNKELREKDTTMQHLRQELAMLQSQLNPDVEERLAGSWGVDNASEQSRCRAANTVGTKLFDELVGEALEAIERILNLSQPIELTEHYTAVIELPQKGPTENPRAPTTLLLTLDPDAERLFLYATLLNHLPTHPDDQLRLYEMLLQGALLGREVAGGGIGVSKEDHLVLLSVSVDLRHCDAEALAANAPDFVAAVQRWQHTLRDAFPPRRTQAPGSAVSVDR